MKFLKSHDEIAIAVLFIVVLSALTMRDNLVEKLKVETTEVTCMDYTDIDTQCIPMKQ